MIIEEKAVEVIVTSAAKLHLIKMNLDSRLLIAEFQKKGSLNNHIVFNHIRKHLILAHWYILKS